MVSLLPHALLSVCWIHLLFLVTLLDYKLFKGGTVFCCVHNTLFLIPKWSFEGLEEGPGTSLRHERCAFSSLLHHTHRVNLMQFIHSLCASGHHLYNTACPHRGIAGKMNGEALRWYGNGGHISTKIARYHSNTSNYFSRVVFHRVLTE